MNFISFINENESVEGKLTFKKFSIQSYQINVIDFIISKILLYRGIIPINIFCWITLKIKD